MYSTKWTGKLLWAKGRDKLHTEEIIEAIHIKKQKVTSKLDCGHSLIPEWQPLLCSP